MSKPSMGYVPIIWDSHDIEYEVLYGHVSFEIAMNILRQEGILEYEPVDTVWTLSHLYGRWIPDSTGEYDMTFRLSKKGPGAFPVTLMERT